MCTENLLHHHRPAIYTALSQLQERGLVTELLTGKRKIYHASKPIKLYDLMDSLEQGLDKLCKRLMDHQEHTFRDKYFLCPSVIMTNFCKQFGTFLKYTVFIVLLGLSLSEY